MHAAGGGYVGHVRQAGVEAAGGGPAGCFVKVRHAELVNPDTHRMVGAVGGAGVFNPDHHIPHIAEIRVTDHPDNLAVGQP